MSFEQTILALQALNRIKDSVPQKHHKDLYYTLFESHISYCISVWGGVAPRKLNPLFIAQKSCIRIMFGNYSLSEKYKTCARSRPLGKQFLGPEFYCKEHTKPLFKELELMTIYNLYTYSTFMELLKILKFRLPYSLFMAFDLSSRHDRATRHKNTYINVSSKPSTNFTYKAAIQWNALRTKLGILDFDVSVNTVKHDLKSMILSNQTSGIPTEWNDQNNRMVT